MTTASTSGFVLNGRHVLALLLMFFGTVFGVNFYMARAAITTFSGLESDKAYQEGVRFDDEIQRAREQAKRGWRVDASVRAKDEGAIINVSQADSSGQVTPGLTFTALFMHPADRRRDVKIELVKTGAGHYQAVAPVPAGRWDVLIEASNGSETLFRSVNRIDLTPGN